MIKLIIQCDKQNCKKEYEADLGTRGFVNISRVFFETGFMLTAKSEHWCSKCVDGMVDIAIKAEKI